MRYSFVFSEHLKVFQFEPPRLPCRRAKSDRLAVGESAESSRELVEVTEFNWSFDFDDAAAFRFDSRAIGWRRSDDHECQPDDREPFHDMPRSGH